jgi:hypothetical protein
MEEDNKTNIYLSDAICDCINKIFTHEKQESSPEEVAKKVQGYEAEQKTTSFQVINDEGMWDRLKEAIALANQGVSSDTIKQDKKEEANASTLQVFTQDKTLLESLTKNQPNETDAYGTDSIVSSDDTKTFALAEQPNEELNKTMKEQVPQ